MFPETQAQRAEIHHKSPGLRHGGRAHAQTLKGNSKMMARFGTTLTLLALTGCVHPEPGTSARSDVLSGVSQTVKDRIAVCAGGMTASVGAGLEAKIGKSLQEGGKVTADLKQEIQGAILQKANAADAPRVYETYVSCLEKPL